MSSNQKASSSKKASTSEKLEAKLRDRQLDLIEKNNDVNNIRREALEAKKKLKEIEQQIALLRSEYKDQQYATKQLAHTLYHKRGDVVRIKHDIKTTELELEMVAVDIRQKEEKKTSKKTKKGTFSDAFLQKVNQLPEVLVELIGTFLPKEVVFDVKIRDLESRIKTQKLISRCSAPLKTGFLTYFSKTRQFLSLLPHEDAVNEVNSLGTKYYYVATAKEAELKILQLIEMAKATNPEFAFDVLKKLHILIDPAKKYKSQKPRWNFNPFNFPALTMEDVEASRIGTV